MGGFENVELEEDNNGNGVEGGGAEADEEVFFEVAGALVFLCRARIAK